MPLPNGVWCWGSGWVRSRGVAALFPCAKWRACSTQNADPAVEDLQCSTYLVCPAKTHFSSIAPPTITTTRQDVRAERLRVEALIKTGDTSSSSIVVRDLRKVFPPQDGGKPKVAVRTLTLGIERGECFGLLGPNGAGGRRGQGRAGQQGLCVNNAG